MSCVYDPEEIRRGEHSWSLVQLHILHLFTNRRGLLSLDKQRGCSCLSSPLLSPHLLTVEIRDTVEKFVAIYVSNTYPGALLFTLSWTIESLTSIRDFPSCKYSKDKYLPSLSYRFELNPCPYSFNKGPIPDFKKLYFGLPRFLENQMLI